MDELKARFLKVSYFSTAKSLYRMLSYRWGFLRPGDDCSCSTIAPKLRHLSTLASSAIAPVVLPAC
eukprot:scaffold12020_cov122-Isochrysis_galbana.AAC.11